MLWTRLVSDASLSVIKQDILENYFILNMQMRSLPKGASFELSEVVKAVEASSSAPPPEDRKVELSVSMVSMVDTFSLNLFSVQNLDTV